MATSSPVSVLLSSSSLEVFFVRSLLPLVIILIALWFLLIRPQRKRQAALQAQRAELAPGAEVMLTSGIFGTVREVTDDHVEVEIADGVTVRVVPAAIGRVLPQDDPEAGAEEEHDAGAGSDGGTADHPADGPVDLSKPEES